MAQDALPAALQTATNLILLKYRRQAALVSAAASAVVPAIVRLIVPDALAAVQRLNLKRNSHTSIEPAAELPQALYLYGLEIYLFLCLQK